MCFKQICRLSGKCAKNIQCNTYLIQGSSVIIATKLQSRGPVIIFR